MKKFLFLFAFMALFIQGVTAQTYTPPRGSLTVTGAALSGADTAYLDAPTIIADGPLAITATVVRTSGTLAGSGQLFVSNNGTDWHLYSATDTMAIANPITYKGVEQVSKTWTLQNSFWTKYQVRLRTTTGVGTARGSYKYTQFTER
jgi:hypothetical protein